MGHSWQLRVWGSAGGGQVDGERQAGGGKESSGLLRIL